MNVLVIGGHGFIGSRVVPLLSAAGHAVSCLVRPGRPADRLDGLRWRRVDGDIRDGGAVARAAQGCDAVIHLASPSSWPAIRSPELRAANVDGIGHVLHAAASTGARVVYVSSAAAIACSETPRLFDETADYTADPGDMPYAAVKQEAERRCRQAARDGVDVIIVNPAEVYGPNDTALVTASNLVDIARSWPVLVCRGGTAVVHVDDAAAGIVAALDRGRRGERYILAGENVTIRQLADLTLACLSRRAWVASMPRRPLRALARAGAAWGLPLPFHPDVIPYATRYWFMKADKARAELGVTFRNAADTLGPAVAWLREQGLVA